MILYLGLPLADYRVIKNPLNLSYTPCSLARHLRHNSAKEVSTSALGTKASAGSICVYRFTVLSSGPRYCSYSPSPWTLLCIIWPKWKLWPDKGPPGNTSVHVFIIVNSKSLIILVDAHGTIWNRSTESLTTSKLLCRAQSSFLIGTRAAVVPQPPLQNELCVLVDQ